MNKPSDTIHSAKSTLSSRFWIRPRDIHFYLDSLFVELSAFELSIRYYTFDRIYHQFGVVDKTKTDFPSMCTELSMSCYQLCQIYPQLRILVKTKEIYFIKTVSAFELSIKYYPLNRIYPQFRVLEKNQEKSNSIYKDSTFVLIK